MKGLSLLVFACATVALASAGRQEGGTFIKWGDATVTGFSSYRLTKTSQGYHLLAVHAANEQIRVVSPNRGLDATCGKVEGNVANGGIETATFSGGVHATIKRPSSEQSSSSAQTAVATGEQAIYSAANNNLLVTGGVHIEDDDPGAGRTLKGSGSSANVVLSPAKSNEEAFRSATLEGGVQINMAGTRAESGKTVPYTLHATCNRAEFQNVAHAIDLNGNVHVTSDDPTVGGESFVQREVIHLTPSGSIESVEGTGDPGTDTMKLGAVKP